MSRRKRPTWQEYASPALRQFRLDGPEHYWKSRAVLPLSRKLGRSVDIGEIVALGVYCGSASGELSTAELSDGTTVKFSLLI
jgi:hypothetical protein